MDLPSFSFPCLITCESFCPNLLLPTENKIPYILEPTTGFETNIKINSSCKAAKYNSFISDLSPSYDKVMFVILSLGAIGVMDSSCISLLSLLQELNFDNTYSIKESS